PVRRAIMDDDVPQGEVVAVVEDAARAAARHLEALDDVMIRVDVDGVGAARDHRASPLLYDASQGDGLGLGAAVFQLEIAGVGLAAVDLDHVAGGELWGELLQGGE